MVARVELLDQLLLRAEVVVGVAGGHPSPLRDRPHRRRLVPALTEQLQGRLRDGGPGLLGSRRERGIGHTGHSRPGPWCASRSWARARPRTLANTARFAKCSTPRTRRTSPILTDSSCTPCRALSMFPDVRMVSVTKPRLSR